MTRRIFDDPVGPGSLEERLVRGVGEEPGLHEQRLGVGQAREGRRSAFATVPVLEDPVDATLEYVRRGWHGCRARERAEGTQQPLGAAPGCCQQEDEASVNGARSGGVGVECELGRSHVHAGYGCEPESSLPEAAGSCLFEDGAWKRRREQQTARLRRLALPAPGAHERDVDLL